MSSRFLEMQKRITVLRRSLLPPRFDPTGLYPDRVHHRTAAFRLLVHAEFESYIEELVTQHLAAKLAAWHGARNPSITLAALLAYDEVPGKPPTSLIAPPQKPAGTLQERLNAAANRFNHLVRVSNHGVRETNVLAMLLPVGLEASDVDIAWLTSLDSWARERGEFAHQSAGKVGTRLDPAKEYALVKFLLTGFRDLDKRLTALR